MIFVTGDTHRTTEQFDDLRIKNKLEELNLTKDDYVIVTGDFGFIWGVNEYHIKDDDKWFNKEWPTLESFMNYWKKHYRCK